VTPTQQLGVSPAVDCVLTGDFQRLFQGGLVLPFWQPCSGVCLYHWWLRAAKRCSVGRCPLHACCFESRYRQQTFLNRIGVQQQVHVRFLLVARQYFTTVQRCQLVLLPGGSCGVVEIGSSWCWSIMAPSATGRLVPGHFLHITSLHVCGGVSEIFYS